MYIYIYKYVYIYIYVYMCEPVTPDDVAFGVSRFQRLVGKAIAHGIALFHSGPSVCDLEQPLAGVQIGIFTYFAIGCI